MKVDGKVLFQARLAFARFNHRRANVSTFRMFFGITKKQYESYLHTGTMKVRAESARKLRAMAKVRDAEPQHRYTLYMAYLAREANHAL